MEYSNYLDNQPSFFDDEKEKAAKMAELKSMTDEEKEEMELQSQELKNLFPPPTWTEVDVMENTPSIFDSEEIYASKYKMLESWGRSEGIIPPEEVKLLVASEESSSVQSVIRQIPYIVKAEEKLKGDFSYEDGLLVFEKTQVIGNFWITILSERIFVKEIVNEQNQVVSSSEETKWDIDILCMGKHYLGTATVKTLLNETEVLKLTMDRGYMENGKDTKQLYKRFINKLIQEQSFLQKYEYGSTGWTCINKKWLYLTDKGVIGESLLPIRANVPFRFEYDEDRVGTKQVYDEFIMLKRLCPSKLENSTFLMHYLCLSIMTTLFQECGFGINFIVALIGSTNSQKTSSAIVFSRLFDRTPKAIPDIRFNSTEVAIMEKMETYGDAILLVDDFLPYEDRRSMNEQMKKSELIIRSYGDRVPRKRSKAYAMTAGVDEFSRVKGCCIITGEVFDTNSESSSTRVVQLNFAQGDVDLELLSFFQKNLLNVPTLLYDYIAYIQEHMEDILVLIKNEVEVLRSKVSQNIATPRFRTTFGIMGTEIKIFYTYAVERGYISVDDANYFMKNDLQAIKNVILQNELNAKSKSPAMTICLALKRAVAKEIICCIDSEDAKDMSIFDNIVMEFGEYLCILPETLWACYVAYCKEYHREIIYKTYREMSAPLRKENAILVKEESKGPRSTHKIPAKTKKRFLYIKKSVFAELCGIFERF